MVLSPLGFGGNSLAYARDDHKIFETSFEDMIPAQSEAIVMGVTTFAPSANSHNNSQYTTISITYNEDIDPATVTSQTFAVHAMQTGQLFQTFSANGGQAILTPSQSIKPGEIVQVSATTGIHNQGGVGSEKPTVWQFRTAVSGGNGILSDSGQNLGGSYTIAVALGDLDKDGDLDVFVTKPKFRTLKTE